MRLCITPEKVHNFFQVLDFVPEVYDGRGKLRPPTELKELRFSSTAKSDAVFCLLNSTLFRWFVNVFSDCRHITSAKLNSSVVMQERPFVNSRSLAANVARRPEQAIARNI